MASLDEIRHSLAHLLAAAVLKKYPRAKLGIGPVIENGFYYDFKVLKPFAESDLKEFENSMQEFIKRELPFSGRKVTPAQAKKIMGDQPFKLELVKDFAKEKKPLTVYKTGDIFEDLCRGGHVKNTSEIDLNSFVLERLAGAYWKGNEKNPQMQRIYGLAFESKKELDEYLVRQEEAKKRDHREIGKRQKLFTFEEMVGSGLPIWLPNGTIIKDEVEKLAREMEMKGGYQRVSTPHIAKEELFKTSGHLPYYADSMFPPMKLDDGNYYLKAMNCPMHHLIYKSEPRSYRDLPLRLAEYGTVYRNELSGTLAGLLRVRMLSMNDAHIYCKEDQVEDEFRSVMKLTVSYFEMFGLKDYWFRLSCWDPKNKSKYINEPKNWKIAEEKLRKVLKEMEVSFVEAKDEAAFYGPKVDVQFKSVVGREETMSTIQLDFAAKKRFHLVYHDSNGKENNEVFVIHRAPLGTHERFMTFLIEHFAGAFPTWLSPVQAVVLPISEAQDVYAKSVVNKLNSSGMRVELKSGNETLGKRIREAELQKIPYIIVVGDREIKDGSVSVRKRHTQVSKVYALKDFEDLILKKIREKK